jgi:hypothetical protein
VAECGKDGSPFVVKPLKDTGVCVNPGKRVAIETRKTEVRELAPGLADELNQGIAPAAENLAGPQIRERQGYVISANADPDGLGGVQLLGHGGCADPSAGEPLLALYSATAAIDLNGNSIAARLHPQAQQLNGVAKRIQAPAIGGDGSY